MSTKVFIPCAGHSTPSNIAANPPTSYTRPGIRGSSTLNGDYSHLFQSQHTTLAFTWKPFLQARSQLAVLLTRDGGVRLLWENDMRKRPLILFHARTRVATTRSFQPEDSCFSTKVVAASAFDSPAQRLTLWRLDENGRRLQLGRS